MTESLKERGGMAESLKERGIASQTSLKKILDDIKGCKIDNVHFQLEDLQKYADDCQVQWFALHDGAIVAACGIVQHNETAADGSSFISTYVCQLSSLKSGYGYGKQLLEWILDNFDNVWLMAMDGTEDFYRSIPRLHEHVDVSLMCNGQKIFVKSDKFAQDICRINEAV